MPRLLRLILLVLGLILAVLAFMVGNYYRGLQPLLAVSWLLPALGWFCLALWLLLAVFAGRGQALGSWLCLALLLAAQVVWAGLAFQVEDRLPQTFGQGEYISTITLEEFDAIIEGDSFSGLLYVGRDNCPQCRQFNPELARLTSLYQAPVTYYNTIVDRVERADEMYPILDKIGIPSVPVLFVMAAGEIEQRFEGDAIIAEVNAYFAATYQVKNAELAQLSELTAKQPAPLRWLLQLRQAWFGD